MWRTLSTVKYHKVPWPHALNKNVFNKCLNCSRLQHCLRLIGSEFHSRGPAAVKHQSPKMLRRAAHDTGRCIDVEELICMIDCTE